MSEFVDSVGEDSEDGRDSIRPANIARLISDALVDLDQPALTEEESQLIIGAIPLQGFPEQIKESKT